MPINFKSSQRDEGKLLIDELNS
jgi:vesicle coat complex subunit